jgi:hypothetical protein
MIRELDLYVYPQETTYTDRQFDKLYNDIQITQLSTQIVDLYSSRQLFLLENAATDEGFRYTAQAFRQLCSIAAAGLGSLMPDLAGMFGKGDGLTNAQLAIRTFNNVINTRFRRIERFLMVLDKRQQQIIGFVQVRNVFVDSQSWLERLRDSIENFKLPFSFSGAKVHGRAVAVWYRSKKSSTKVNVPGSMLPLYDGAYYCNGERLGSAVCGARACFFPGGILLGDFKEYGGVARHSMLDFESAYEHSLEKIAAATLPINEIGVAMHTLAYKKLLSSFPTMRNVKQIRRLLSSYMTEFKVEPKVVERAVDRAIYGEQSPDEFTSEESFLGSLAQRTWFDVVSSILKEAKAFSFSKRERIEQAIFNFLVNYEEVQNA